MSDFHKDQIILRSLAERYSEIANLDIQKERIERYYKTNSMEEVRPVVLVDEVPWGEIKDDELICHCENQELRGLEWQLRASLYKWNHFQADYVIPPVFRIGKRIQSSGIGMGVKEDLMKGDTGTYIVSHRYKEQLDTEEDLEKLKIPVITYDKENTEKAAELASNVFSGLLPVKVVGTTFGYSIWDHVYQLRGVEKFFMDFSLRPDFMHKTAKKFTDIGVAIARQYQDLDLLDPNPLILHCTPACAKGLPAIDFSGKIRLKDVWGRGSAQIFSSVSPRRYV